MEISDAMLLGSGWGERILSLRVLREVCRLSLVDRELPRWSRAALEFFRLEDGRLRNIWLSLSARLDQFTLNAYCYLQGA